MPIDGNSHRYFPPPWYKLLLSSFRFSFWATFRPALFPVSVSVCFFLSLSACLSLSLSPLPSDCVHAFVFLRLPEYCPRSYSFLSPPLSSFCSCLPSLLPRFLLPSFLSFTLSPLSFLFFLQAVIVWGSRDLWCSRVRLCVHFFLSFVCFEKLRRNLTNEANLSQHVTKFLTSFLSRGGFFSCGELWLAFSFPVPSGE